MRLHKANNASSERTMRHSATPQSVLVPLTEAAIFLVAKVDSGTEAEQGALELSLRCRRVDEVGRFPHTRGRADLCGRDRLGILGSSAR